MTRPGGDEEDPAPTDMRPPRPDGGRGAGWRATGKGGGEPGPVGVLRVGHRPGRDKRITTHVCLAARALGADIVYVHEDDARVMGAVQDVVDRFGGPFSVLGVASWRAVLDAWKTHGAQVVHLSMYGLPLDEGLARLDPRRATLFVVGAQRVPAELYTKATVNLAVGNQPHSELAALAVVLDRFFGGTWAAKTFQGRVQVSPRERGKAVSPGTAP